jgi:hypothetical protein
MGIKKEEAKLSFTMSLIDIIVIFIFFNHVEKNIWLAK